MDRFSEVRERVGNETAGRLGCVPYLIVGAIVGVVLLFAVTWGSTGVKEIGLHYSGGPVEGQKFVGIIPPGQPPRPIGLADDVIKLPNNQRTYITTEGTGGDSGALTATNADGNLVRFETSMTFNLVTDPGTVSDFYEDICTKYQKCRGEGWGMLLDDYLRKVQETTLQSVSRSIDSEAMAQNPDVLASIGQQVNDRLTDQINRTMGGPYFEVSEFQVNNIILPENVLNKYEQLTASKVETQKATQQADTAKALQETLKDNPAYLELLNIQNQEACIENGDCRILYVPQGSELIVQQP